ncbi:hypothetical protein PUN28_018405 [Cardiocondyla obscurior]|uniref:Uncharacterized protein n=1 Tax=Cardiocondyla obscurior TaxID=286306 RepID=A0AAW2EL40_9HYME
MEKYSILHGFSNTSPFPRVTLPCDVITAFCNIFSYNYVPYIFSRKK